MLKIVIYDLIFFFQVFCYDTLTFILIYFSVLSLTWFHPLRNLKYVDYLVPEEISSYVPVIQYSVTTFWLLSATPRVPSILYGGKIKNHLHTCVLKFSPLVTLVPVEHMRRFCLQLHPVSCLSVSNEVSY